jgi:uncharacterized OsmC-like protein
MQALPHLYRASAVAEPEGLVTLASHGLSELPSAPPTEFDGVGDRWSPETLITAAVGDCLILTFRAVAKASKLEWTSLRCEVEGTLDRVDSVMRFTRFDTKATLTLPAGVEEARARRVLEKAERNCIITASLKAEARVEMVIVGG